MVLIGISDASAPAQHQEHTSPGNRTPAAPGRAPSARCFIVPAIARTRGPEPGSPVSDPYPTYSSSPSGPPGAPPGPTKDDQLGRLRLPGTGQLMRPQARATSPIPAAALAPQGILIESLCERNNPIRGLLSHDTIYVSFQEVY